MTYLDKLVDYTTNTPHNTNAAVVRSLAERYAEEMANSVSSDIDILIDRSITEISSDVTTIGGGAFCDCTSLTTIDFPSATTIGVNAFYGCTALTTINFPQVTTLDEYAFYSCTSLTTVDLPSATTIGHSGFRGCTALTEVKLPQVTTLNHYAFYECSALSTVDFPLLTSIRSRVFLYCRALATLILRSETMATLEDSASLNETAIASGTGYIYVPAALVDTYKAATGWSKFADQFRALEDYTIDGTITGELDLDKI